jgi:glycosyltransferase involved in cell wall biosynthesis
MPFSTPSSLQITSHEVTLSQPAEFVSVVIPCYNEERFILKALQQLAGQYDPNRYEIIVVDGLSIDDTRSLIEQFKNDNSDLAVRLVDNPARNIPTALNLGVAAARGNIIARMDAHAFPSVGYIRRCVEVLRETDAAIVGMPCRVQPGANTLMARAIAGAVSHPFGIGDAKYRLGVGGPLPDPVATVAFACFRKSLWIDLGGFNEALLANEDYDFNYRARRSGGQVILDKSGHCDYFARTTLKALAKQYLRYGGWKAEMIRLQPRSIRLRHLVAPLFVISLAVLLLAGLVWPFSWWLLLAEVSVYLALALAAGWQVTKKVGGGLRLIPLLPVVFVTIHLAWGSGFLFGVVSRRK